MTIPTSTSGRWRILDGYILEIYHRGDTVQVLVDADTDLEQPFTGECKDTGEQLHFREPWALDIALAGITVSDGYPRTEMKQIQV